MNYKDPKVTVLMPVYNGEEYLREAIESILNQTFRDFEFLIISEHGTSEESLAIVESYSDERIRHIHNTTRLGLVGSLNLGLKVARGEYIARMDGDDISLPERFELQVRLMDKKQDVGICGTWVETIQDGSCSTFNYPTDSKIIQSHLLFDSSLAHPSVIFRKIFLERFELKYDINDLYAEDWSLWQKCSFIFPISNIPIVLLKYRITKNSISRFNADKQLKVIKNIHKKNLQALCGDVTDAEIEIHTKVGRWQFRFDRDFIDLSGKWLVKLKESNNLKKMYPEPEFSIVLGKRWLSLCMANKRFGYFTWSHFSKNPLSSYSGLNGFGRFLFLKNCLKSWFIRKIGEL